MTEKVVIGNAELWHGDCREVLPLLPPCDLILTDPPYGIGIAANPVRQAHEKMEWDAEPPAAWLWGLMQEKAASLIVWGGNYFPLPPSQTFLVWDKMQPENFSLAMCEQAWCSFKKPRAICMRHCGRRQTCSLQKFCATCASKSGRWDRNEHPTHSRRPAQVGRIAGQRKPE